MLTTVAEVVPTLVESDEAPNCVGSVDWQVTRPFWATLLRALPFQYLAYFPAAVFLGHVQGINLVVGLLAEAAWALFFIALSRWLYRLGLRQYSAYGG